jgi:uncharacterized protein YukE
MTDAALPITQTAVESFTERYLTSLGAEIEKKDNRWTVAMPEHIEADLPGRNIILVCDVDETELTNTDEVALHPESDFFHRLLDEAAERQPVGAMRISGDDVDCREFEPLLGKSVVIENEEFYPYYDRRALAVFFRISIETVSEYETELLRAVAIDERTHEPLPDLADSILDRTKIGYEQLMGPDSIKGIERSVEEFEALRQAREQVERNVRPTVTEIHDGASRAADAEFEGYYQLQEQRIDELQKEVESLSDRIEDLSQTAQRTDNQQERVESLRERRDLRSQHNQVEEELTTLFECREAGFPDEQHEIRRRHSVRAIIEPVAITAVEYEVGDLEVELRDSNMIETIEFSYGSGVGLTEEPSCSSCDEPFSSVNTIRLFRNQLVGDTCCR